MLPWNENVNYWLTIKDVNILYSEILNYFTKNNNKILDIDFILKIDN